MGVLRPRSQWFSIDAIDSWLGDPGLPEVSVSLATAERQAGNERAAATLSASLSTRGESQAAPTLAIAKETVDTVQLSIDAFRSALVERARLEAELEGRSELAQCQHEHELRLAALRQAHDERRYKGLLVTSACVVVVLTAGLALLGLEAQRARALAEQRAAMLELEKESRKHAATLLDKGQQREATLRAMLKTESRRRLP